MAGRKAGGYSLGMRQRLGLAAAMLGDPPILLLDEPFNGLDPEGIVWMRGFLRELAAEGRAVFVSSHLMGELQDMADDVVVIGRGRLVADTSVAALLAAASRGLVRLRTAEPAQATAALSEAGATVVATGPDTLTVSGLASEQVVGLLGAHARALLRGLGASRQPGGGLHGAHQGGGRVSRRNSRRGAAMSAAPTPYRSNLPAGSAGFPQLLHAEWTKLRTVRGWMIALIVAGLLVVGMAYLATFHHQNLVQTSPDSPVTVGHPFVPLGPGGEAVTDTFYFVHQSLQGNGSITVRLSSLTGLIAQSSSSGSLGHGQAQGSASGTAARPGLVPWAKAGLIIKEGTTPGSTYAALMITGAHGVRLQYDYTHDIAGSPAAASTASPHWLRLSRSGDVLSGSESADGVHWTTVGSVRLAGLPKTVQVGLFVTSPPLVPLRAFTAPSASSATAVFDQVSLAGQWPQNAWSGLGVGAGSAGGGAATPTLGAGGYRRTGDAFAVTGSGDIAPAVGDVGYTPYESLQGVFVGLLIVIVLGALFISAEYRRGLIRSSFAASPRRGRVLAAKALVLGAAAFAVGLIAAAIALPLGDRLLRTTGNYLYPVSVLTEARVIAGNRGSLCPRSGTRSGPRCDAASRCRSRRGGGGAVRPALRARSQLSAHQRRAVAAAPHSGRRVCHPAEPREIPAGELRLHAGERILPSCALGRLRGALRLGGAGSWPGRLSSAPEGRVRPATARRVDEAAHCSRPGLASACHGRPQRGPERPRAGRRELCER